MNTHEARNKVVQLIGEGVTLNPADVDHFHQWIENSYQALAPFSTSQQQFDKYCRSSTDSPKMRAYIGVHLLMLAADRVQDKLLVTPERTTHP
jgi:hypothetical protein